MEGATENERVTGGLRKKTKNVRGENERVWPTICGRLLPLPVLCKLTLPSVVGYPTVAVGYLL